jgi:hypothetical protein
MSGMRRNSIFWALALIGFGTFLLIRRTGHWQDVSLGPIILIALGLWLLSESLAGGRGAWGRGWLGGGLIVPLVLIGVGTVLLLQDLDVLSNAFSVGPVVLIAVGAAILLGALRPTGGSGATQHSIPLEGATSARVTMNHGAGRLTVVPLSDPTLLMQGTFSGGAEPVVRRSGQAVDVSLRQGRPGRREWSGAVRGRRGLDWTVGLTREIPLAVDLRTGASASKIDLSELLVTDLRLETGASQTDLVLPSRGATKARVKADAAQLRIRIPNGVAARLLTNRGLSSIRIDPRFTGSGDLYQSPDFDAAPNRVELEIEAGAADVSVS